MQRYRIEVKEYLARIIDVDAESEEDAIDMVEEQYHNGDIVLDYKDFTDHEIKPYITTR